MYKRITWEKSFTDGMMYAIFYTRLEIHFAVGIVSQLKQLGIVSFASRDDFQEPFWDPNFVLFFYLGRALRLQVLLMLIRLVINMKESPHQTTHYYWEAKQFCGEVRTML